MSDDTRSNFDMWYDEQPLVLMVPREFAERAYRAGYADCMSIGNAPSHLDQAMLNGAECIRLRNALSALVEAIPETRALLLAREDAKAVLGGWKP